jgi:hypothetical protein
VTMSMAEKSGELEPLLAWARKRGFFMHASTSGRIIVLAKAVPRTIDIAHIRGPASAAAARLVNDGTGEYLASVLHCDALLRRRRPRDGVPGESGRRQNRDTEQAPYTPPGRVGDGVNPLYVTDGEGAKMKVYRPIV